jgi:hypothetical protein
MMPTAAAAPISRNAAPAPLGSRPAAPTTAAGLAATMLGAALLVHLPAGYFLPNGVEVVLTLFGASVALALAGAGEWSVDARLARRGAEVEAAPAAATAARGRRAA